MKNESSYVAPQVVLQSLHVASKEMLASVYCPTVHLGHDLPGHVGPAPAKHTVILQGPRKVRPFSAVPFGANVDDAVALPARVSAVASWKVFMWSEVGGGSG